MLVKAVGSKFAPFIITIILAFQRMSFLTCSWVAIFNLALFFYMSSPAMFSMLTISKFEVVTHIVRRHCEDRFLKFVSFFSKSLQAVALHVSILKDNIMTISSILSRTSLRTT